MPEQIELRRTGQSPLAFVGELVGETSSHTPVNGGPLQNRWHDLAVYRTAGGRWVAAVVFRTIWQGEADHYSAEHFDDPRLLVDWLSVDYSPRDHWQGFPASEHYAEKQARTEQAIAGGYRRAVSEVLGALPEAAERIE